MYCLLMLSCQREQQGKKHLPITNIGTILQRMSLNDKILMLGGTSNFYIREFEGYNVPRIGMSDGPVGIRRRGESTSFPASIALAASFDKGLALQMGKAIGSEARSNNIHILLAPAMNIYRAPFCGRNFEYFGEDPYLAGQIAAQYVFGVQNEGVIATAKHYVANNQEYKRHEVSSDMDERTLREIYLPAFKTVVKKANVGAVMTSYNPINGVHASQNGYLINDILKNEWGFEGIVISDWNSTYNGIAAAKAGLDIEMPKGVHMHPDTLLLAIEKGLLDEAIINEKVRRILQLYKRFGLLENPTISNDYPTDSIIGKQTALDIARGGTVLLKNENSILPINTKTVKSVAIIGPNGVRAITGGGGSSFVHTSKAISLYQSIKAKIGNNVRIDTAKGVYTFDLLSTPSNKPSLKELMPDNTSIRNSLKLLYSEINDEYMDSAIELAEQVDLVIMTVGFNTDTEGEGRDRLFELPYEQANLIRKITTVNKQTIVIVNAGGNVQMDTWFNNVSALVYGWYPGEIGNEAIAEILLGEINPSGKLPVSFERKWEDSPTFNSYFDENDDKRVMYKEGIFIGYRHYDQSEIKPLFPFGFGLSYTSFAYSNATVSQTNFRELDTLRLSVDITNTGNSDGAEIVQLYVNDLESSLPRPIKELKGFEKVFLKQGESKTIGFLLDKSAFSYFDPSEKEWVAEPGKFVIMLGSSSVDIRRQIEVNLQ